MFAQLAANSRASLDDQNRQWKEWCDTRSIHVTNNLVNLHAWINISMIHDELREHHIVGCFSFLIPVPFHSVRFDITIKEQFHSFRSHFKNSSELWFLPFAVTKNIFSIFFFSFWFAFVTMSISFPYVWYSMITFITCFSRFTLEQLQQNYIKRNNQTKIHSLQQWICSAPCASCFIISKFILLF